MGEIGEGNKEVKPSSYKISEWGEWKYNTGNIVKSIVMTLYVDRW